MPINISRIVPKRLAEYLVRHDLKSRYHNLSIGSHCTIIGSTFGKNVDIASDVTILNCQIGDCSYIGPGSVICNTELGKYCSIAPGTYVGMGTHPVNFVSTHPLFYLSRPEHNWTFADKDYFEEFARTKIGNDVWLGLRVAIRDGVTIGDGAIVGAGAVVVKDISPYSIVGGTPAKHISNRFKQSEIDFLLSFKWWDKDDKWLKDNFNKFHDINEFIISFSK